MNATTTARTKPKAKTKEPGTAPRLRYRQGSDLELAVKRALQDDGYYVIKSAGSKGPVDLIAVKRGEVLMIQAKTDGYVPPAERMIFFSLAVKHGATCLVARWHKPGARAARIVAYEELTSASPAGHQPWTPDHGLDQAVAGA